MQIIDYGKWTWIVCLPQGHYFSGQEYYLIKHLSIKKVLKIHPDAYFIYLLENGDTVSGYKKADNGKWVTLFANI